MAHRGRLNVLAHVLRRNYTSIMAEFEGRPGDDILEDLPVGGAGDVKYHHGARSSRAIDVVVREAGERAGRAARASTSRCCRTPRTWSS